MKGNCNTSIDLEIHLEEFAAELTKAAYAVALRHGARAACRHCRISRRQLRWRLQNQLVPAPQAATA